VRVWILALSSLSILVAPMTSRAADQCPMADGWYRRWIDCDKYLRPLGEDSSQRAKSMVEAHTVQVGSAVTWEEEADAIFLLLPEDLRQRPALDYIQCRAFETGRICKSQWEERSRCMTMRKGHAGLEFPAGANVEIDVRTSKGADFRGASAALPPSASAETSGAMRVADGRLRWDFGYGSGSAKIHAPESAGPWTLSFDELATHGSKPEWKSHGLDFASGDPSPHVVRLRPETHLTIAWSCDED